MLDLTFYRGKKVLVTGHTGFKGTWLCKILINYGANVVGYSLKANEYQKLYDLSYIDKKMNSFFGDVRNIDGLLEVVDKERPEIIFHLAAQPIVRESYRDPRGTYETNVMGTVNVLECIRKYDCIKSFVNVTTDKVYENKEWEWGYRENENLNGYDPYSNSKSCSELVTSSYKKSFFNDNRVAISTVRAGNVIGGGDFSVDRIIPDCVRAVEENKKILVRNPYSIRPYQHVLEPLRAYLMIAKEQYFDVKLSGSYNVGPNEVDCITTGELVDLFCKKWGDGASWVTNNEVNAPHEANFLKLDCSKIKKVFNCYPIWNVEKAIEKTVEWTKAYLSNGDVAGIMDKQIFEFFSNEVCL